MSAQVGGERYPCSSFLVHASTDFISCCSRLGRHHDEPLIGDAPRWAGASQPEGGDERAGAKGAVHSAERCGPSGRVLWPV
jgi:hypothetical protein